MRTKAGTLINPIGSNQKWIKYHPDSKVSLKWGLREVIKEYKPNGELLNMTYIFSENPLFGYQRVNGSVTQMRKIWNAVVQLADKKSVANFLEILSKCR